jgi:hypothetical protein
MGRHGRLVLVNGQHQPVIPAGPGAPQRWRIINGCTSRVLPIRLAGHQLIQMAGRCIPDVVLIPARGWVRLRIPVHHVCRHDGHRQRHWLAHRTEGHGPCRHQLDRAVFNHV